MYGERLDNDGNVISVGNLVFEEGTLGQGTTASVRLAHKTTTPQDVTGVNIAVAEDDEASDQKNCLKGKLGLQAAIASQEDEISGGYEDGLKGKCGLQAAIASQEDEISGGYKDGDNLVAVKIFNKSILKRRRTMERNSSTRRIQVRTAFENVEKEIAIMKRMRHPNIVRLIEVIDSEDSDSLYMVLEYVPKGEIMTFIPELECFKRMPKKGEDANNMAGVVQPAGYFDETHAALYFVDILHGLAYLHQHHICHRDLKPENILLDANGVVKITDLGVSHFFEDVEDKNSRETEAKLPNQAAPTDENLLESESISGEVLAPTGQFKLTASVLCAAQNLKSMSRCGLLTKTEGTYSFWSPGMVKGDGSTYSGYAADMWAAGVCLFILATGKLPFYCIDSFLLFHMIALDEIDYENFKDSHGEKIFMSMCLSRLLQIILTKDPDKRAGIGDCLSHPFLRLAREQRLDLLGAELDRSKLRKLIISEEDIRKAFAKEKFDKTIHTIKFISKMKSKFANLKRTLQRNSKVES